MQPSLLRASNHFYRTLLRAYPSDYQKCYAEEMVQVFRTLSFETWKKGGYISLVFLWISAFWDGILAAMIEWIRQISHQRVKMMAGNSLPQTDSIQPLPARDAIKAVLPFLLFGLTMFMEEFFPVIGTGARTDPAWLSMIVNYYFLFTLIIFTGLAAGILAGFPRWTYTYLGWGLWFTIWWTLISFSGMSIGFLAWIPFLAVLIVPMLVKHTIKPLVALANGIWQDWTLFSLALYIFASFAYMLYDENHHPYLWIFMICAPLVLSLGAWGYFRLKRPLARVLSLFGGLLAAAILSEISYATWDYRAYYGLPASNEVFNPAGLAIPVILGLVMIGTGLLSRWWMGRHPQSMNS